MTVGIGFRQVEIPIPVAKARAKPLGLPLPVHITSGRWGLVIIKRRGEGGMYRCRGASLSVVVGGD